MDYSLIRVLEFEILPLPEAFDTFSPAAMRKRTARLNSDPFDAPSFGSDGINMTPQVEIARSAAVVQDYFSYLRGMVGKEVAGQRLIPTFPADGLFKWAHPVEGTTILVSLGESDTSAEHGRYADVLVHCPGMNLGSAGGPTLQPLGAIARLTYQGLFGPNISA